MVNTKKTDGGVLTKAETKAETKIIGDRISLAKKSTKRMAMKMECKRIKTEADVK